LPRTTRRAADAPPLTVTVEGDEIRVGPRFSVAFQRTLRIPDDDRDYPLPPGLGRLPIVEVDGQPVIPLRQGEALWLAFGGEDWHPNAVQVGVGGVNAVTGEAFGGGGGTLLGKPQNYLVVPEQPWLDGIKTGDGVVRQFVAAPLGSGVTVEGQVTGEETRGGIQLRVFEAKAGRFPDEPPPEPEFADTFLPMAMGMGAPAGAPMGVAAGGRMRQRIYPDPHGVDTWDADQAGDVDVRVVNSEEFRALTGQDPPPSPITARVYTEHGYPWFELYDADSGDVAPSDTLGNVNSVGELTGDRPEGATVDPTQVKTVPRGKRRRSS